MSIRLSDYGIDENEWSPFEQGFLLHGHEEEPQPPSEAEWPENPYQAVADAQVRAGAWPGTTMLREAAHSFPGAAAAPATVPTPSTQSALEEQPPIASSGQASASSSGPAGALPPAPAPAAADREALLATPQLTPTVTPAPAPGRQQGPLAVPLPPGPVLARPHPPLAGPVQPPPPHLRLQPGLLAHTPTPPPPHPPAPGWSAGAAATTLPPPDADRAQLLQRVEQQQPASESEGDEEEVASEGGEDEDVALEQGEPPTTPWGFLFEFAQQADRKAPSAGTRRCSGAAAAPSAASGCGGCSSLESTDDNDDETEPQESSESYDSTAAVADGSSSARGSGWKLSHHSVPKVTDFHARYGAPPQHVRGAPSASCEKAPPRPGPSSGLDCPGASVTTLMIRHIPNVYTRSMLVKELEVVGLGGLYDFLYLPIDKSTQWNVGYAFVNFVTPAAASKCVAAMSDYVFRCFQHNSGKVTQISVAHIQGLQRNLEYYSKTAVQCVGSQMSRPLVLVGGRPSAQASANPGAAVAAAATRPGGTAKRRRRRPQPPQLPHTPGEISAVASRQEASRREAAAGSAGGPTGAGAERGPP